MKGLITYLEKYKGYNRNDFIMYYFGIPLFSYFILIFNNYIFTDTVLFFLMKIGLILSIIIFFLNGFFGIKNTYGGYLKGSKQILEEYNENNKELGFYNFKKNPKEVNLHILDSLGKLFIFLYLCFILISCIAIYVYNGFIISVSILILLGYLLLTLSYSIKEWVYSDIKIKSNNNNNNNNNIEK